MTKKKEKEKEMYVVLVLQDLMRPQKELNFGKFGKTVAPPGRRLPATRYRKHLEDLKKRSKRMEYGDSWALFADRVQISSEVLCDGEGEETRGAPEATR